MDLRRLRAGDWILGFGSALLLLSLFTGWYEGKAVEVRVPSGSADYTLTAFEAFSGLDLILAAGALYGLGIVVASAMQHVSAMNIAGVTMAVYVAVVLLILVLYRVARIPDFTTEAGSVLRLHSGHGPLARARGLPDDARRRAGVDSRRADHRRHAERRPGRHRGAARAATGPDRVHVNLARLQRADVVAVLAALVLLVVMAMDWYSTVNAEEARRIAGAGAARRARWRARSSGSWTRRREIVGEQGERNAWQEDGAIDRVILVLPAAGLCAGAAVRVPAGGRQARRAAVHPGGAGCGLGRGGCAAAGLPHVAGAAARTPSTRSGRARRWRSLVLGLLALALATRLPRRGVGPRLGADGAGGRRRAAEPPRRATS